MWILIDNYDSFTHMLHHYLLQLPGNDDIYIVRNDGISLTGLQQLNPSRIIISPGPGTPAQSGITTGVIEAFHKTIPILGICLGHQALGEFFGAQLAKAELPMHGKISRIFHEGKGIFENIPSSLEVMRYHSLLLTGWQDTGIVPLAFSDKNELMAFEHEQYNCVGLQFHPESVSSLFGLEILQNWHRRCL
jgi:anthranilate synthase/aminodeoxychorismate synthase-like glutamine amidotransferase